jgi:hypothetical protein
MRINNFTELSNFLQSNNLSDLGAKLISCTKEYSLMCSCKPKQKADKLNECISLYISTINGLQYQKHRLFTKATNFQIQFYNNGQLVNTISK